jgi:hypothetical protein
MLTANTQTSSNTSLTRPFIIIITITILIFINLPPRWQDVVRRTG